MNRHEGRRDGPAACRGGRRSLSMCRKAQSRPSTCARNIQHATYTKQHTPRNIQHTPRNRSAKWICPAHRSQSARLGLDSRNTQGHALARSRTHSRRLHGTRNSRAHTCTEGMRSCGGDMAAAGQGSASGCRHRRAAVSDRTADPTPADTPRRVGFATAAECRECFCAGPPSMRTPYLAPKACAFFVCVVNCDAQPLLRKLPAGKAKHAVNPPATVCTP